MNLSNVAVGKLQDALADVATGKAEKRLMIALAYKDGVSVETLSERYAIPRSTLYYWLDRFEKMPIEEAIRDEDRPGRPTALTQAKCERLQSDLNESPQTFGFDSSSWSAGTLQEHIDGKFGVEYSVGHIRRLLRSFNIDSPYL